ncbi:hypothetical protein T484DRAFT_1753460 [Baffinella frigidus]|nr:hypothetical protein T484DRAFT_1753460 [Cryptophyta sp. CCMP2293]
MAQVPSRGDNQPLGGDLYDVPLDAVDVYTLIADADTLGLTKDSASKMSHKELSRRIEDKGTKTFMCALINGVYGAVGITRRRHIHVKFFMKAYRIVNFPAKSVRVMAPEGQGLMTTAEILQLNQLQTELIPAARRMIKDFDDVCALFKDTPPTDDSTDVPYDALVLPLRAHTDTYFTTVKAYTSLRSVQAVRILRQSVEVAYHAVHNLDTHDPVTKKASTDFYKCIKMFRANVTEILGKTSSVEVLKEFDVMADNILNGPCDDTRAKEFKDLRKLAAQSVLHDKHRKSQRKEKRPKALARV